MKTGFVLPSCNYNIVLSEEDLKQLLAKGYISMDPNRTFGIFRDEYGIRQYTTGHNLMYTDQYGENHVQFVGIGLERPKPDKEN